MDIKQNKGNTFETRNTNILKRLCHLFVNFMIRYKKIYKNGFRLQTFHDNHVCKLLKG